MIIPAGIGQDDKTSLTRGVGTDSVCLGAQILEHPGYPAPFGWSLKFHSWVIVPWSHLRAHICAVFNCELNIWACVLIAAQEKLKESWADEDSQGSGRMTSLLSQRPSSSFSHCSVHLSPPFSLVPRLPCLARQEGSWRPAGTPGSRRGIAPKRITWGRSQFERMRGCSQLLQKTVLQSTLICSFFLTLILMLDVAKKRKSLQSLIRSESFGSFYSSTHTPAWVLSHLSVLTLFTKHAFPEENQ